MQGGFDIVLIEPVCPRLRHVAAAERWEALMTMHIERNRIDNDMSMRCKKIGIAESEIDDAVRPGVGDRGTVSYLPNHACPGADLDPGASWHDTSDSTGRARLVDRSGDASSTQGTWGCARARRIAFSGTDGRHVGSTFVAEMG